MSNDSVNEDMIQNKLENPNYCYVIFVVSYITVEAIELGMKEAQNIYMQNMLIKQCLK